MKKLLLLNLGPKESQDLPQGKDYCPYYDTPRHHSLNNGNKMRAFDLYRL